MTTMNTCSLLLVAVAIATIYGSGVICTSAPSPAPTYPDPSYPCPWRKVANPKDPFIQNLGKWAVDQEHIFLHFNKVESAKLQSVGPCTTLTRNLYYELIIDVSHRDDFRYMVVVYVVNFTQPKKVLSFDAIVKPPYRPTVAN